MTRSKTIKKTTNGHKLIENGQVVASGKFTKEQLTSWKSNKLDVGDCFEVSARLIIKSKQKELRGAKLCHGIVTGQGPLDGCKFGHAWLEYQIAINNELTITMVMDNSNGKSINLPAELYYRIGQISEKSVERYSQDEVKKLLLSTGHYGPWKANNSKAVH